MKITEKVCSTCKRPLDVPGDESSTDCDGDCTRCMADAGDPDCIRTMQAIAGATRTNEEKK